jgi:hypothetical protein
MAAASAEEDRRRREPRSIVRGHGEHLPAKSRRSLGHVANQSAEQHRACQGDSRWLRFCSQSTTASCGAIVPLTEAEHATCPAYAAGPLCLGLPDILVHPRSRTECQVDVAVRIHPAAMGRQRIPSGHHVALFVHQANAWG